MGPKVTKLGLGFRPPVRLFPFAVGLIAAIAGIVVLAGWALDVRALESVVPGFATMKVNTSLGIMLLGLALALMQCGAAARRLGKAAAGIAIIIGVITLIEYALDLDAGIDQLLFTDSQTLAIYHPGRPSHATAFNLMILGIGLLCVDSRACRCLTTALAMIASLVSWVALNGYLFGAPALYGVGLYSSIALHTAALFFLYSLGLFAAQPQCSPTKIVLSKGIGGTLSRWLLPFAVLAPPALGWAFRHGQALGIYHGEFSWALYSVASSVGSVALILLLAHRIAALDAERSKATELSRRDPLTGLPNRRAFDAFLLESFRLARRHVRPLSLLMLDVDHFKEYNDSFGHPSGDEALQTAAHLLGRHARETDLVARIGGEEFAIVLPETDLAGALLMGERIRDEVERSMLFRSPMTVSIGAASLAEGVEDTAQFVKECDTALYLAKQRGRNRVSWIGEPMSDNEPGIGIQA
jgi:diguanylate cyclase (GGDEF)-like protein